MMKQLRFTWGNGIFLLYTGFVAMIIFLVVRSTNEKVDLVASDYYKQELQYQQRLDQIKRANTLSVQPTWKVEGKDVLISFPENMVGATGQISFFKPSDKNQDITLPLNLKNGMQTVPLSSLNHGAYKLQLSWAKDGLEYFREGVIFIEK